MTQPPDPPSPNVLAPLTAYAASPRGGRAGRTWTVDELLPLLDPTVSVAAIAERMGVKRSVVSNELARMRRFGLPVPVRSTSEERSPRTIAIEADLRSGMTNAEAARRHEVAEPWVRQIRIRAGIPPRTRPWTDDDRQVLITHQDRPVHEMATLLDRSVRAVYAQRQLLIAQGRIRPKKMRRPKPAA